MMQGYDMMTGSGTMWITPILMFLIPLLLFALAIWLLKTFAKYSAESTDVKSPRKYLMNVLLTERSIKKNTEFADRNWKADGVK